MNLSKFDFSNIKEEICNIKNKDSFDGYNIKKRFEESSDSDDGCIKKSKTCIEEKCIPKGCTKCTKKPTKDSNYCSTHKPKCKGLLKGNKTCSNKSKFVDFSTDGYCHYHSIITDLKVLKSKKEKCKGISHCGIKCSENVISDGYCHLHSIKTEAKKSIPKTEYCSSEYFMPKHPFHSATGQKAFVHPIEKKTCSIKNCTKVVVFGRVCISHTPVFDSSVDSKIIEKYNTSPIIQVINAFLFFEYNLTSIIITPLVQKEKWKKKVLEVHPDKGGTDLLMRDAVTHRSFIDLIMK